MCESETENKVLDGKTFHP